MDPVEEKTVPTEEEEDTAAVRAPIQTYQRKVSLIDDDSTSFSFKKLWRFTGPGFLMSIAYLDPGNIESDLQAGAISGYKLIWVLLVAHILGLFLQRLAARIGVVSGKHMAEVAHSYYPTGPRLALWVMVELAIIGSDMQEVIGTAISLYLLSNTKIPLWAGVLITICDTFTFLFLEKYGVRKFEAFFAFLITAMAVAFGFEFFEATPNAGELFSGMFLPWCMHCDGAQWLQAVAIIGAVVMPHNFYLHSALVKSRNVDRTRKPKVTEANFYFFVESAFALFCSFWINFLVVGVFAKGLYGQTNGDILDICNDNHNGMPNFYKNVYGNDSDAATADIYHAGIFLGCSFGVAALYVWAVGILAAGQSSTMTGTYAGQFAMEGFIRVSWPQWKRVLLTRTLAIGPTLFAVLFSKGIDTISQLNDLLNCIQMVQLPYALIPVLTFASDKRIMFGYACSGIQKIILGFVSVVIILINFYFLWDWIGTTFGWTAASVAVSAVIAIFYVVTIAYLTYYCLVAMEAFPPFLQHWMRAPKYRHFDAPWEGLPETEPSWTDSTPSTLSVIDLSTDLKKH